MIPRYSRPDMARLNSASRDGALTAFSVLAAEFTSIKDPEKVRLVYAQSVAFVDWLIGEYERDPEFFSRAKTNYLATRKRR